MGYYLNSGQVLHKAEWLIREHRAKSVSQHEARNLLNNPSLAVVVVVNNGLFDAVAFLYGANEFAAFTMPDDMRLKRFLIMNRELCKQLSGFKGV